MSSGDRPANPQSVIQIRENRTKLHSTLNLVTEMMETFIDTISRSCVFRGRQGRQASLLSLLRAVARAILNKSVAQTEQPSLDQVSTLSRQGRVCGSCRAKFLSVQAECQGNIFLPPTCTPAGLQSVPPIVASTFLDVDTGIRCLSKHGPPISKTRTDFSLSVSLVP